MASAITSLVRGGGQRIADEFEVPLLGHVPRTLEIMQGGGRGHSDHGLTAEVADGQVVWRNRG